MLGTSRKSETDLQLGVKRPLSSPSLKEKSDATTTTTPTKNLTTTAGRPVVTAAPTNQECQTDEPSGGVASTTVALAKKTSQSDAAAQTLGVEGRDIFWKMKHFPPFQKEFLKRGLQ